MSCRHDKVGWANRNSTNGRPNFRRGFYSQSYAKPMIPAAFDLATHANAALSGYEGKLPDWEPNLEWVFLVPGPNGDRLRKDLTDWALTMRHAGAKSAWMEFDEYPGVVVEGTKESWFYSVSGRRVEDGHFRYWCKGRPFSSPKPERPPGLFEAAEKLVKGIEAIASYNHAYRTDAEAWQPSFQMAQRYLGLMGTQAPRSEVPPDSAAAFPGHLYSTDHGLLLAAAAKANVVGTGGMGSWMDYGPRDESFNRATRALGEALASAYSAASFTCLRTS